MASGGVQPIGNLAEAVLEQVTLQVQGHGGRLVSEHLLDDLDIRTGRDRKRRGSVTQAVRHDPVEARCDHGRVPDVAAEIGGAQDCAGRRHEHQIVSRLALDVLSEQLGDEAR